jgi:hypothetical protein
MPPTVPLTIPPTMPWTRMSLFARSHPILPPAFFQTCANSHRDLGGVAVPAGPLRGAGIPSAAAGTPSWGRCGRCYWRVWCSSGGGRALGSGTRAHPAARGLGLPRADRGGSPADQLRRQTGVHRPAGTPPRLDTAAVAAQRRFRRVSARRLAVLTPPTLPACVAHPAAAVDWACRLGVGA